MYIVSLSFDDGFEKSNLQIADIYEKFDLSACFNVLAREEVDGEKVDDPYHNWPKGVSNYGTNYKHVGTRSCHMD